MMGSNVLMRRGLAASGGAIGVTMGGWFGEHTVSQSTARVVSKTALERFTPRIQTTYFSTETVAAASTTTTTTAATKSASPSFVQWYEGHLERSPVLTKAVTGSILWGLGDAVAQLVPHYAFQVEGETKKELVYDWARTGRAVTFGGIIHAPTSHLHYNFLEWMTVRAGLSGLGIPVFKTIMEQFVYWSWISNSMYHAAMGAMQGMTPDQIYDRIADVLMDTQKAQWAFWIPIQLLNFNFIPVRHQLNVVLLTSVVWTALLSMWYPPVVEETPEDVKPE